MVIYFPGVGQGMTDNPKVGITFVSPRLLEYSLPRVVSVNLEALSNHLGFHFTIHSLTIKKG
jgi:hypothetical protein